MTNLSTSAVRILCNFRLMSLSGIVMTASAEVLNVPFVKIFTDYDERLFNMTCHGFISAAISLLRTLLFQLVYIMVLPLFFSENGIRAAIVRAELSALVFTIAFFVINRKKYHYA